MKKILFLLLLLPSVALAQGWQIPNPAGTPRALPTPGTSMSKANVDIYGNQQVVTVGSGGSGLSQSVAPVSRQSALNGVPIPQIKGTYNRASDTVEAASTTTVLNLTAHSARVGDVIKFRNGTNTGAEVPVCSVTTDTVTLCAALVADPSTADIWINSPQSIASFMAGGDSTPANGASLAVAIDSGYQNAAATGILKLEDAAHVSGDAGVAVWGIRNETPATFADGNGDYSPLSLNRYGTLNVQLAWNGATSTGGLQTDIPYMPEDVAVGAGQVVMLAGARVKGDFNASAADLDAATINVDLDGRLATNPWGADTSETGQSCGTATASTANVEIKAAIVSTRIYVGSITCASSDADNATNINFKDGSTVVAVGGVNQMATTSAGTFTAQFNPPLRGTVNTAFNFNTAVSTSSVICCASWYTSGN
jgi:hypothetical protein